MIEYSIHDADDPSYKYLAWIPGHEPLVNNVVKQGWWISAGRFSMYFTRANIWVHASRNGKKDISFSRDDDLTLGDVGGVTVANGVYTVKDISIADQIILERMVKRVHGALFKPTLTKRKVRS